MLLSEVVGRTTVRWIRATLEGRLATAIPNYSFRRVVVSRGYMQGGVLSSLLWCLVVDEPIARLNRGGVYTQGHTDDICLLEVAKFPNTVLGLKQWILHTIQTWCRETGLLLNPEKTAHSIYKEKETSFLWTSFLWSYSAPFYVGQVCWGSPGFLVDLEAACKYQSEEGSKAHNLL
jgi:hypothetical protein